VDAPKRLVLPAVKGARVRPSQTLTDHEQAMVSLSHALESMAEEDANIVAARSRQVLSEPASQIDAAVDRVEAFLRHQGSKK